MSSGLRQSTIKQSAFDWEKGALHKRWQKLAKMLLINCNNVDTIPKQDNCGTYLLLINLYPFLEFIPIKFFGT